jgi:hypothetical protein
MTGQGTGDVSRSKVHALWFAAAAAIFVSPNIAGRHYF